MSKSNEVAAMRLALEAMQYADACLKKQLTTKTKHEYAQDLLLEAGKALEEALAQSHSDAKQEQSVSVGEPVAWMVYAKMSRRYFTLTFDLNKVPEIYIGGEAVPLYTTPQQRKPLTLEQLREHWQVARVLDMTDAEIDFADYVLIARDVEALYGIKE